MEDGSKAELESLWEAAAAARRCFRLLGDSMSVGISGELCV
jgi:hypothetical protein